MTRQALRDSATGQNYGSTGKEDGATVSTFEAGSAPKRHCSCNTWVERGAELLHVKLNDERTDDDDDGDVASVRKEKLMRIVEREEILQESDEISHTSVQQIVSTRSSTTSLEKIEEPDMQFTATSDRTTCMATSRQSFTRKRNHKDMEDLVENCSTATEHLAHASESQEHRKRETPAEDQDTEPEGVACITLSDHQEQMGNIFERHSNRHVLFPRGLLPEDPFVMVSAPPTEKKTSPKAKPREKTSSPARVEHDETSMLQDFLDRVRAEKATMKRAKAKTPPKSGLSSSTVVRPPLDERDPNSPPSQEPAPFEMDKADEESHGNALTIKPDAIESNTKSTDTVVSARRSQRRRPTAPQPPSDGAKVIAVHRVGRSKPIAPAMDSAARQLAALTRANTKRNQAETAKGKASSETGVGSPPTPPSSSATTEPTTRTTPRKRRERRRQRRRNGLHARRWPGISSWCTLPRKIRAGP